MAAWESPARVQQSPYSHPLLAELIFAFDRRLQRRHGVLEYSDHAACIFRVQICSCSHDLILRDGTRLQPTDRVACLHYWNEHMPSIQRYANRVDWARDVCGRISRSLGELLCYLNSRPDLGDVNVVCAHVTSAVKEQSGQISRIMQRYGFETIYDPEPLSARERLSQLAENILISMMVLAQNADTLRRDTLRRVRVPIYVSRRELERRFASAHGIEYAYRSLSGDCPAGARASDHERRAHCHPVRDFGINLAGNADNPESTATRSP